MSEYRPWYKTRHEAPGGRALLACNVLGHQGINQAATGSRTFRVRRYPLRKSGADTAPVVTSFFQNDLREHGHQVPYQSCRPQPNVAPSALALTRTRLCGPGPRLAKPAERTAQHCGHLRPPSSSSPEAGQAYPPPPAPNTMSMYQVISEIWLAAATPHLDAVGGPVSPGGKPRRSPSPAEECH